MKVTRLNFLLYALMAYTIFAGGWWAYLLYQANEESYHLKKEILKRDFEMERGSDKLTLGAAPDYEEMERSHSIHTKMIFAEAIVLFVVLMLGIWFVQKSFKKIDELGRRQKNFLLSVTHELKSPIASIQLILETMLKRALPQDKFQQFGKNAINETHRLGTLVENMLLAARIEDSVQLNIQPVNISEMLGEIMARFAAKYPQVQFNQDIQSGIWLEADVRATDLVICNLLENAIKYSPEEPQVDVVLSSDGQKTNLSVADNGVGIPNDEKRRIFEKFYRVGNEDTRSTKGTGLGLFIVKKMTEGMKGEITVTENTPKGTVFRLEF